MLEVQTTTQRSRATRRRIGNSSKKALRRVQRKAERLLESLLESGPRGGNGMKGHTLQRSFLLALMVLAALVFVLGVIYLDPGEGKTQTAEPVKSAPASIPADER